MPGFLALQQMSRLLLAERVPPQGRVLVLGAGGGLELKAFAEAQPGWQARTRRLRNPYQPCGGLSAIGCPPFVFPGDTVGE